MSKHSKHGRFRKSAQRQVSRYRQVSPRTLGPSLVRAATMYTCSSIRARSSAARCTSSQLRAGRGESWTPRRQLLLKTPSKTAALEFAKSVAVANQPSQVVLLDEFGRLVPIAHYQLPQYPAPQFGNQATSSVFEGAVKALLIGGLMAAGIAVLGDVVQKVDRDLEKETSKSRRGRKSR